MKFKRGIYKTLGNYDAIVAQLKCNGPNEWMLVGAIVDPSYECLRIHRWTKDGISYSSDINCNLVEK